MARPSRHESFLPIGALTGDWPGLARRQMLGRLAACFVGGTIASTLSGCGQGRRGELQRLRLGHVYEVNSPTQRLGMDRLNDVLAESGVGLRVSVYPAAQLGNEAELLEQLVAGEIDMAISGPSFLGMWHPPVGVFDAAYAFPDLDRMLAFADGPLMAPHWQRLRELYGVRVLATWAYGVRHLTANRPIRTPAQLKGFRLRMPGARIFQESGAALGASPMPMAFSEVYMALQQGIADGQENPIPVIESMGFLEVQKFLILTGHIQSSIQILINERSWQRLAEASRTALAAAIERLGQEVLRGIRREEAELLAAWQSEGKVTIIADVDEAAFRQHAAEHFGQGFDFSPLYRELVAADEPGVAAPSGPPAKPELPATPATGGSR